MRSRKPSTHRIDSDLIRFDMRGQLSNIEPILIHIKPSSRGEFTGALIVFVPDQKGKRLENCEEYQCRIELLFILQWMGRARRQ